MPLSVTIQSVTLAAPFGVNVTGTGSPNDATVDVHVQINGGGAGNNKTVVNNGQWSTPVMLQASSGQQGTATATITSPQFPGQQAQDSKNFTL